MTLKLYELADAYRMLLEADEDAGTGSFEEALNQIGGELNAKAESIAKVIRSLEAEVATIDGELDRLKKKAESRQARITWLKDYLQRNMEAAGLERCVGVLFTVALQASPPRCEVLDPAAVPMLYQTVIPASMKVDARALIERWKLTGENVPGSVVTAGKHIRIR